MIAATTPTPSPPLPAGSAPHPVCQASPQRLASPPRARQVFAPGAAPLLCALLSCAGPTAPRAPAAAPTVAPVAAAAPAPVAEGDRDSMSLQGGMGQIDQAQVQEEWKRHMPEVNRCYTEVLQRHWYLSGELVVKVRLGETGQVRAAAVVRSTLGNYDIERCVTQVALRLQLPAPKGGAEAEFSCPVEFPARATVRTWPEDRVAPELSRHRGELTTCRRGGKASPSALRLTVYIGPGGRVSSAGLSADEPIDERLASCLLARTKGIRFDDPLGELVKASYAFD